MNRNSFFQNKINLWVIGIGLLIIILAFFFFRQLLPSLKFIGGQSALRINVENSGNEKVYAYLNGIPLGETPIEGLTVPAGEKKVTISTDVQTYETTLPFVANTEVVIRRELGVSDLFSGGHNLWIEKNASGTSLSIISEPAGATVLIDGTETGKTPYVTNTLTAGEYSIKISYPGFSQKEIRVRLENNHKLNVSAKLFPSPVPDTVKLLEGSTDLYDLSTSNPLISSVPSAWVRAVVYWNKTRGINILGSGLNKELVFDYFIDYLGNIYDKEGNSVSVDSDSSLSGLKRGAYLGRSEDVRGLTASAKNAYESISGNLLTGKTATILETGTGWLRVRSEPNLSGAEVARVDVGKSYAVLEENASWIKISVDVDTQGWVSSTYVDVRE